MVDIWDPEKDDYGILKIHGKFPGKPSRRDVKKYSLIDKRTRRVRGEECDLFTAIRCAKVLEVKYRTKILVRPIYKEA